MFMLKKQERSQISNLTFQLKEPEKEQTIPKATKRRNNKDQSRGKQEKIEIPQKKINENKS